MLLCLQDAKMGILFDSFPPVLQIQLRRFEYDFVKDVMIKVNATENPPGPLSSLTTQSRTPEIPVIGPTSAV